MTSDTTTRQTITITLSNDRGAWGSDEDVRGLMSETGATERDLYRVNADLVRETIEAAYPEYDVEVEHALIMTARVDAPEDIREHVGHLVFTTPGFWELGESELVKRIKG